MMLREVLIHQEYQSILKRLIFCKMISKVLVKKLNFTLFSVFNSSVETSTVLLKINCPYESIVSHYSLAFSDFFHHHVENCCMFV